MLEVQESDRVLVERCARGDESAFRLLVERYAGAVYRLARRQLGSESEAEDVTQETFFRLYRAARRYRPEVPLGSYLRLIAARLCLNRRARKENRLLEFQPPELLDSKEGTVDTPRPEETLERRKLEQKVRQAIDSLPANQRLALVLMRFEGLDCRQIGRLMGRSPGAVHALLFRARGALQKMLRAGERLERRGGEE